MAATSRHMPTSLLVIYAGAIIILGNEIKTIRAGQPEVFNSTGHIFSEHTICRSLSKLGLAGHPEEE
jgi:hypothetical protein